MTLATVPRYDPEAGRTVGDRAVVVGAGVAGLVAARVLADWFEAVTVLERDALPDEPAPRRGVPQSRHLHVLQEAGLATLDDLLPGLVADLCGAGAVGIEVGRDADFYAAGGFLAAGTDRYRAYSATRHCYEHVLRRRVAALDGVSLRTGWQCTGYLADDAADRVRGVAARQVAGGAEEPTGDGDATAVRADGAVAPAGPSDRQADAESLHADLVVDATGRASRTGQWLADHGYEAPPVSEVGIDVGYTTALVERPPADRRAIAVRPSVDTPRGATVLPVEGDRWMATLSGVHGDHAPTDREGFLAFADSLAIPHVAALLREHEWASDEIHAYPFASNRRLRYEDLDRVPGNLLAIGDAVASFNPIYGQGMSVAALEALGLHHALAAADDPLADLAHRFFDAVAETVDVAWTLAIAADHEFPQTTGPKPRGTDLANRYLARLLRTAHDEPHVADAFLRVQTMERPPSSLFRPGVAWRVLRPW